MEHLMINQFLITHIIGFVLSGMLTATSYSQQPFSPERGIILRGTVVTMDAAETILQDGNILVRNGKIAVEQHSLRRSSIL